jgi:uridine phosphorylase
VTALKEEGIEPVVGYVRTHDGFYTEQPSDPEGPARIAKWAKLGVLLNEHECSSMFVISEILKLNAAAVIVAEENVADGTALNSEEKKEILDKVYRAVVRVLSK